jgi:predicted Fe-Mo cluster-binding NifX family protein
MTINRNIKFNKIAIPTNDGYNIFAGMLGQADFFYIYEINKSGCNLLEKRLNPHAKTLQHLKTLDVYQVLNDCGVILSSKIGKKGIERLQERHIKLIIKRGRIEDALNEIIKNDSS